MFDDATASDVRLGLRLAEGRLRERGKSLSPGAREMLRSVERSLAVLGDQPLPPVEEPSDVDGVQLLDLRDVTRRLKLSEATVRRRVRAGALRATRVGRSLRFRLVDVQEFIDQLPGTEEL